MSTSLTLERGDDAASHGAVRLRGRLLLADGAETFTRLRHELEKAGDIREIDLSGLEKIDGAGAAWLLSLRADAIRDGHAIDFTSARPETARMLGLYRCPSEFDCLKDAPHEVPVLEEIGSTSIEIARGAREVMVYTGNLLWSLGQALRRPRSVNWNDVPRLIERAGADAIPIVLLINFLIGLIVAMQAAEQLQRFGANVFLSDLVGLSITRELAPLITAIIASGRSGAAYAAELGTMNVSEEIDALRTLGLDPHRHLVMPRMLALALVAPFLTVLGMAIAIFAGMLIGVARLDLTPLGYFTGVDHAVHMLDLVEGCSKSFVFSMLISFIACQRGLAARGGASGVGASTTSAVVTTIFHLVAADAVLSATFNALRA
ncbi:MAG: MlaE family lipid ABC transporter permease subunit [Planctomycetota bacterium]